MPPWATRSKSLPQLWAERDLIDIRLPKLGAKACARLFEAVAGLDVPPALQSAIIERADGNPFFLEELMRGRSTSDSAAALPETTHTTACLLRQAKHWPAHATTLDAKGTSFIARGTSRSARLGALRGGPEANAVNEVIHAASEARDRSGHAGVDSVLA